MRAVRDIDKVSLLVERGAEVDARSARRHCAHDRSEPTGCFERGEIAARHKANPRTPDAAGVPPLMYATDFGDLESVKALVAAGAEIDGGAPMAPALCSGPRTAPSRCSHGCSNTRRIRTAPEPRQDRRTGE